MALGLRPTSDLADLAPAVIFAQKSDVIRTLARSEDASPEKEVRVTMPQEQTEMTAESSATCGVTEIAFPPHNDGSETDQAEKAE